MTAACGSAVKVNHVKPGKGGAFAQVELKNLRDGRKLNERFRSEDKVERVRLDQKDQQFLYETDGMLVFMDAETFEQIEIPPTSGRPPPVPAGRHDRPPSNTTATRR
jgi:translation elongation factor P/translation initiation factor 5A